MKKTTSVTLKEINKSSIFKLIYNNRRTTKQNIADELKLSLPTVTANLNELLRMGLIEKNGYFQSYGGRKPASINCVPRSRVAIGVNIQKYSMGLVAIDLYGALIKSELIAREFKNESSYYQSLGESVANFILALKVASKKILGIGFALQAKMTADNQSVLYGEILGCTGLKLSELSEFIHYPCRMTHDAEADAYASGWFSQNQCRGVFLALNNNIGSALINFGNSDTFSIMPSSAEHLTIDENGEECYCRRRGCFDIYCSLKALTDSEQCSVEDFFASLRKGESQAQAAWSVYIKNLSIGIERIRMVMECNVILGGRVGYYMCDEDLIQINAFLAENASFFNEELHVYIAPRVNEATATGAALLFVKEFLDLV